MTAADSGLEDAIRSFIDAEQAMRSLMTSADGLRASSTELDDARAALQEASAQNAQQVAEAVEVVGAAQRSVADASSAVYRLSAELTDVARNLADTAIALRSFQPEKLHEQMAAAARRQQHLTWVSVAILCFVIAALIAVVVGG